MPSLIVPSDFPLFLCVTGLRGTHRTTVFNGLKARLEEAYPDLRIASFEDPFTELPHPIVWADKERRFHPVSRLFLAWAPMHERNREIKAALAQEPEHRPDIMIIDGYGANTVLYATACICGCVEADEEVLRMHHEIIRARIIEQGIFPPLYIITRADPEELVRYIRQTLGDHLPDSITDADIRAFILKEEAMLDQYFREGSGQTAIGKLDFMIGASSMIDTAFALVQPRIERKLDQGRLALA